MSHPALLWDIFCQVIDNHGDLGVCWRLSAQLAARGQQVRLWVDDATALAWMAPGALHGQVPGVQVLHWSRPLRAERLAGLPAADVWVEGFGCELPPEFLRFFAPAQPSPAPEGKAPLWLNLEYLSAESYVERSHALPSPVMSGPARGMNKWFYYPGFTTATGGLLREADLATRQTRFDRRAWLAAQGIAWRGERLIALFCYEPPALAQLINQLRQDPQPSRLLVTAGRANAAVQAILKAADPVSASSLAVTYLPHLPQPDFDHLLWSCDLNLVRGEDSLVRALWAGQALVWQIYPQDDKAHHRKLQAYLDGLQAPPSLRAFHGVWNNLTTAPLPPLDLAAWHACTLAARARLLVQDDLITQLQRFVEKKR